MSRSPDHPCIRFFGVDPSEGAARLLGVHPDGATQALVMRALDERLRLIADQPAGPDADEARLALHAAAAELLEQGPVRVTGTASSSNPLDAEPAFAAQARSIIARSGGWNRRSRPAIALAAAKLGVPPHRWAAAILGGPSARETPPPKPQATPPDIARRPSIFHDMPASGESDDQSRTVSVVLMLAGGVFAALLAIGLGVVGVLTLLRPTPPAPPVAAADPPAAPVAASRPGPAPSPAAASEPIAPTDVPPEPAALVRLLDASVESMALDPGAGLRSAERITAWFAEMWPSMSDDQIRAGVDRLVDLAYRTGSTPSGVASVRAMLAPLEGFPGTAVGSDAAMRRALFAAGLAARWRGEASLPAGVRAALTEVVESGPLAAGLPRDGSFRAGAVAAAVALAPELAARNAPGERWSAWVGAMRAAAPGGSADRVVLSALDLLISGTSTDVAGRTAAIRALTLALGWRDGDEARRWLVARFDAPGVPAAAIHELTRTLATSSGADIDPTMVLSPGAGPAARSDLRDRLARAWGIEGERDRAESLAGWIAAARAARESDPGAPDSAQRLARAVVLMRLNLAAELLHAGDAAGAASVVALGERDIRAASELGPERTPPAPAEDNGWVARYLSETAVATRLGLIGEVGSGEVAAPVAEVLVVEALRGSPAPVRSAARAQVRRLISRPEIINALLEEAPTMARTNDHAELIAEASGRNDLPEPRDARWRSAARAALVSRLLELRAGDARGAAVERLVRLAAEIYRDRSNASGTGEASASGSDPVLDESARAAAGGLQRRARAAAAGSGLPNDLGGAESRWSARVAVAQGPGQRFAAHQLAAAEFVGVLVAAEEPSLRAGVEEILSRLRDRRRSATHLFEQIDAAEDATLSCWLLRLTGEAS